MINWKCRLKSREWWLAIIPAFFLVVQTVAAPFGYDWDFVILNQQLAAIVNAVFAFLVVLGVNLDPTTAGWRDSKLAMGYESPRDDAKITDEDA